MKNLKQYCTSCKKEFPIDSSFPRCDECNEPVEVELFKTGFINSSNQINQTIWERYADFLPFQGFGNTLTLGEGFTSLVESRSLAEETGTGRLFFKMESQNPTWSFKDRGTFTGLKHAIRLGYNKIGTVSTGNMAASVAAYGAKAGLKTYILVSKTIAEEKLNPVAIYNPILIKVDGDYGDLYFKSIEIGSKNDIYFINSDVPFRVEGYKTGAFEICEQLEFQVPDYVIVPTSAGGHLRGIIKGFEEFRNAGLIKDTPKFVCAQASRCSPIYNAFSNGMDKISRIKKPDTIAHAISNPYPPSGNAALKKLNETGGLCTAVSDEEILRAQKILAENGFFVQPASATSYAAVQKLKKEFVITAKESVVCLLTGSGLKYTEALKKYKLKIQECKVEDLAGLLSD
ncbi:threonine synthase [candidate division KSB1 bacterium]